MYLLTDLLRYDSRDGEIRYISIKSLLEGKRLYKRELSRPKDTQTEEVGLEMLGIAHC